MKLLSLLPLLSFVAASPASPPGPKPEPNATTPRPSDAQPVPPVQSVPPLQPVPPVQPLPSGMNGTAPGMNGTEHGMNGTAPPTSVNSTQTLCPAQPPALIVGPDWDPAANSSYAAAAAERLSAAVQIATVSYDDMPSDPADARWDAHKAFAEFLQKTFPTVYAGIKHEAVNIHAHLYTWAPGGGGDTTGGNATMMARDVAENGTANGSANGTTPGNSSGPAYTGPKPILLMAHEDVVPAANDTINDWTFPPFSGHVSENAPGAPGKWIWGRGASDTKNSLMGILSAVEQLLAEGFTPSRPILVGFGFDEEIGGALGQAAIAKLILERYGENGVELIVDEGFSGVVDDVFGVRVASVGMQEVGSVSYTLSVRTLGGHSSSPLPHTGIGYMAKLISHLEDNQYPPSINAHEPFVRYLSCLSAHAPAFPGDLKTMVDDEAMWPQLAEVLAQEDDRVVNAFIRTTTAVDLINGGVKINALPEVVNASINHRIAFTSNVNATNQHYLDVLVPYAQSLHLDVTAFGEHLGVGNATAPTGARNTSLAGGPRRGMPFPAGNLSISFMSLDGALEPAPTTPVDKVFDFVAGTIKGVWGNDTVVSPTGMYANTDTAHYWKVSRGIYRFTPALLAESLNQHTVDERISLNAHLSTIRFYYRLMRNTEGWTV